MHLGRGIYYQSKTVGRVNPSNSAFYQSKGREDGSLDEPMAPPKSNTRRKTGIDILVSFFGVSAIEKLSGEVNVCVGYQSITFEASDRSRSLPLALIHILASELSLAPIREIAR